MADSFVLTPEELSERWKKDGITVDTLRHWRERKKLKGPGYRRLGLRIVYPVELVEQYERECQIVPGKD